MREQALGWRGSFRPRTVTGVLLACAIAAVSGFLIYVAVVSTVNAQPLILVPTLLGLGVGLFLCIRVPDNNVGVVVLVGVLCLVLLDVAPLVQEWAVTSDYPVLGVVASMAATVAYGWVSTTLLILLPIWFPDGVAINVWSRWTARAAVILAVIPAFAAILSDRVCVAWEDVCTHYETNPWGISGLDGSAFEVLYIGIFLLAIPAMASVVLRWRRSKGIERAQLKWFAFAAVLFIIGFMIIGSNESLVGTTLATASAGLALSAVWIAIGLAITRYRLYEIDKVISRTLTYTLVVILIGAVYFGLVTLITLLIPTQDSLAVAGSTLAAAALFNPIRRHVQRTIDRRFNRSAYEGERIVEQFSVALRQSMSAEQLAEIWNGTVADALQPAASGVWLKTIPPTQPPEPLSHA